MGSRVYVCPITGDGSGDDPFRALAVDLVTGTVSAVIGSVQDGASHGQPHSTWCVAHIEAEDFSVLDAHADFVQIEIPDDPDDFQDNFSGSTRDDIAEMLPGNQRNRVRNTESYRELLHELHRIQYPEQANEERFVMKTLKVPRIVGGQEMVPFIEDSFTNTDETLLQNHSPDTGGDWLALSRVISTVFETATDAEIISNQLTGTTTTRSRGYRNAQTPPSNECNLSITLRTGTESTINGRCYLAARMAPSGDSFTHCYYASVGYNNSSTGMQITRIVGGGATVLSSANPVQAGMQTETSYDLTFEVTDDLKRFTVPGLSSELSTTDNEVTITGFVAIGSPGSSGGAWVDDFVATEAITPAEVTWLQPEADATLTDPVMLRVQTDDPRAARVRFRINGTPIGDPVEPDE